MATTPDEDPYPSSYTSAERQVGSLDRLQQPPKEHTIFARVNRSPAYDFPVPLIEEQNTSTSNNNAQSGFLISPQSSIEERLGFTTFIKRPAPLGSQVEEAHGSTKRLRQFSPQHWPTPLMEQGRFGGSVGEVLARDLNGSLLAEEEAEEEEERRSSPVREETAPQDDTPLEQSSAESDGTSASMQTKLEIPDEKELRDDPDWIP